MVLAKDVAELIDFFTFVMWIFYVLVMTLVLVLRKTMPDTPRPYRVCLVLLAFDSALRIEFPLIRSLY